MSSQFHFHSNLGNHIQDFLAEKQAMGFKYIAQSYIMQQFDRYWVEHGFGTVGLTPKNSEEWTKRRTTEGAAAQHFRVCVIREFSRYLNGLGISSYIPPLDIRRTKPLVHILCDEEVRELFKQIDSYVPKLQDRLNIMLSKEYPVLFRLIYSCGLRKSEACELTVEQINLDSGILTLRSTKGDKDRLIYLAEDMRQLCTDYFNTLCEDYGYDQKWFFPGRFMGNHIQQATVSRVFKLFWERTSYAASCDAAPTVHALRHTYVVKRINLWMSQGLDLNVMMPYLSKHLGHKGIDETYYYYHYVEESARAIAEKDSLGNKVIPEVRRR